VYRAIKKRLNSDDKSEVNRRKIFLSGMLFYIYKNAFIYDVAIIISIGALEIVLLGKSVSIF